MALRFYLTKITGDGQTPETAYNYAFRLILPNKAHFRKWDGNDAKIGFIVADTTAAEHTTLTADGRIRSISNSLINTKRIDLTPGQVSTLNEILTAMNYTRAGIVFTDQATIKDLLRWIIGKSSWDGWDAIGV